METLTQTLERLAMTFTVKDIMVPRKRLVCASTNAGAKSKLKEHPDFDSIPIMRKNGAICAYFHRHFNQRRSILLEDIISDATSILDLVDILKEREFCFILTDRRIAGYIHFSDLNNPTVKIPFFVILENLERRLVEEIRPDVNAANLNLVLNEQRIKAAKLKMQKMERKRADYGWTSLLYFNEIVNFAVKLKTIRLKGKKIDLISNVRNLIAHADGPLVEEHAHVRRLSEAKDLCLSLLKSMSKNE